eukprot:Em0005g274a
MRPFWHHTIALISSSVALKRSEYLKSWRSGVGITAGARAGTASQHNSPAGPHDAPSKEQVQFTYHGCGSSPVISVLTAVLLLLIIIPFPIPRSALLWPSVVRLSHIMTSRWCLALSHIKLHDIKTLAAIKQSGGFCHITGQRWALWQSMSAANISGIAPNDDNHLESLDHQAFQRSFSKLTGAGPTGLRMQHQIDAAEVSLSCSIHQSLKAIVNILAAGGAPPMLSSFLAGGNLTAPPMLSSFLAGGNLTALVKSKQVFCLFVNKPINNVALEISVNMAILVSAVPVSVETALVIDTIKAVFSRHGILETVCSDYGPQFRSGEEKLSGCSQVMIGEGRQCGCNQGKREEEMQDPEKNLPGCSLMSIVVSVGLEEVLLGQEEVLVIAGELIVLVRRIQTAHNNPEIEQNTHKKPVLSSPQRASYQKQGEREIAPRELQNRKRRASPDAQPIYFAQKRVHVDERRENVYSSKESKERKRGSSSDDGRRHHHTTKTTVHDDVTNISEQEPPKLNHRKESQDHEREYSEPVKSERELWSEPASDHPVTERADLLGLSDTQVKDVEEELDYDENMDDIDVHVYRPEDLDVEEKDNEEKNTDQSISSAPEPPAVSVLPDEPETLGEVLIRSPIRVSPERKRFKAKDSERLPVKERLYLSKSAIQRKKEERLVHYHEDPKPQFRPSLASRLGPAPRRRGSKHKESSGKESAAATVDEYRKKKQEVDMRQEDIERARRIAISLNEHETKPATRAHATEDKNTQPQEKEKSLDEVIDKIKEKNKSIVRRKKEIEMDVEQYGQ